MYVGDSDVYAAGCYTLYYHKYVVFLGEYLKDLCQLISPTLTYTSSELY